MQQYLHQLIVESIGGFQGKTAYREPLLGFARADNPGFGRLRELVGPDHLLPEQLLVEAKTVLAFFIPFDQRVVASNRTNSYVSREWAIAYLETNQLIGDICTFVQSELAKMNIKSAWVSATHNFDTETLTSYWSHRHAAYLCGLGSFGLNHMLITPAGCAGRLGSMVLDCEVDETGVRMDKDCLFYNKNKCRACLKLCPVGALSDEGIDRHKCYQRLLKVSDFFGDLGVCDVCGKCVMGPCALESPLSRDRDKKQN